ncbi:MAG: hypothetical protein AAFQ53_00215 [Bacteroidota bacterium]
MFRLADSMPEAQDLAATSPNRFEVGSSGWVTVRFSAQEPVESSLWRRWLSESYDLAGT